MQVIPLSISSLGPTEGKDVVFGKDVKGQRVNALLINNDESLVSAVADLFLKVNNLGQLGIHKLALRLDELLPLLGRVVVERRVDFTGVCVSVSITNSTKQRTKDTPLLVLERDIQRENVRILNPLGHVGVTRAVVHHKAFNETRVRV